MRYFGDFATGVTLYLSFNTSKADGTPITLAGTPAISVYKGSSTTESTSGVTLTVDFDSRTGCHLVAIDTSSDGAFYATGSDFRVVITTGTVDSISVVGVMVGSFSLNNRSPLRPTTAGRTLDVSSGGEAGLDWANIGTPSTSVTLSGTTVNNLTTKTGYSLASTGLDSISTTAPSGVATNFREMMVQVWRRFFRKATRSPTAIVTFADDGATTVTSQVISDDGSGNEVQGAAS